MVQAFQVSRFGDARIWEFPKIRGTLFRGLIKGSSYLGYYIRVPNFRKLLGGMQLSYECWGPLGLCLESGACCFETVLGAGPVASGSGAWELRGYLGGFMVWDWFVL